MFPEHGIIIIFIVCFEYIDTLPIDTLLLRFVPKVIAKSSPKLRDINMKIVLHFIHSELEIHVC